MKQYRFSIDDNILVFRDLAREPYTSLFDNPYLGLLRSIHDEFGTKIQLNIYYEMPGFTLDQMPDRYKPEWEAAADWLKLSFHGRSNSTSYKNCSYAQMYADCQLVHREILRFAGAASLSCCTTIHYVACPKEGIDALADCGIRGLVGLFGTDRQPRLPYHLTEADSHYMRRNCFLKDPDTGMGFFRNDIVLNAHKPEAIIPILETRNGAPFIEIMIHEQYFHRDNPLYQQDFPQKLRTAIGYLVKNGYTPAFFDEIINKTDIWE